MNRAKALGKARYEICDPVMHAAAVDRLRLETDLRGALERDEFRAYYQPIVSLGDGRITGFEALMRWQREGAGDREPRIPLPDPGALAAELPPPTEPWKP